MEFLNWVEKSQHFSDEDGLPDFNYVIDVQVTPDGNACWVVGYNAIGCKYSAIFDDESGGIDQELENPFGISNESWNTKYSRHERMFEMYLK